MHNSHRRSIKTLSPVSGSGTGITRSRSCHTLSGCPWAERQNLVYGFSVGLALRQVGTCVPLSPSPGLSQRAETALEQIRRNQHHHGKVLFTVPCLLCLLCFPLLSVLYHSLLPISRRKSCEPFSVEPPAGFEPAPSAWEADILST